MDELKIELNSKEGLYETLQKEKSAYEFALARNYEGAFQLIQEIVDHCTNDYEKGWYLQLAANYKNHVSQTESNKLQIAAFTKNNQLLKPIEGIVYNKIKYEIDFSRNQRIFDELNKYGNYSELTLHLEDLLGRLSYGVEAEKFESAFYELGILLGYISQRPDKAIRKGSDVLWCVASNKYVLIECKSEVLTTRKNISKSEAGQMDEHCGWFESEYGSAEVLNVLAIPALELASDAYFTRPIKIIRKNNLEKLKKQVRAFFKEFKKYEFSSVDIDFIQNNLVVHNLCDDYFLNSFLEEAKRSS